MTWTTVSFGKYWDKHLTLPQIALKDPDYFLWAYEKEVFDNGLAAEAEEIYRKISSIRIPDSAGKDMEVEYIEQPFECGLERVRIVSSTHPGHNNSLRSDTIDLRVPRKMKRVDRLGNDILVRFLKEHYFGSPSARLTKKRCEKFFENEENFAS